MDPIQLLVAVGWLVNLFGLLVLAQSIRDFVRERHAQREVSKIMAERAEFRPLLDELLARAQEHDSLPISEREQIDLREQVQQALMYMHPAERKRVERGLLSDTVQGREMYLRRVLYASMERVHRAA